MIDYQRVYHTGILVADLTAAMDAIGPALNLEWTDITEYPDMSVWTPAGITETTLRVAHSRQGPQHIELLQGSAGGFWDPAGREGAHHVGIWVDDMAEEAAALQSRGWLPVLAAKPPEQGYGILAYFNPPGTGLFVELVHTSLLPRMSARWAGLSNLSAADLF